MKKFFFLFIILLIANCSNTKNVYWCGDHQCINKKEKEAYFKKTMIVEIRDLNKEKNKKDSNMNKILKQAKLNEKKRLNNEKNFEKEAKIELKKRIKKEKEMKKQAKLDEKERIKKEKEMKKQAKLDEKKRIQEEKELEKKVKKDEKKIINVDQNKISEITKQKNLEDSLSFENLVEEIFIRDSLKPYPDINGIRY